jgi:hypothetical protein
MRKAAPRKKSASARGNKATKDKNAAAASSAAAAQQDGGGGGDVQEVEVDDEGNVIDPHEARYCLCNRVSFGTMIQCDNVDVSYSLAIAHSLTMVLTGDKQTELQAGVVPSRVCRARGHPGAHNQVVLP